MSATFLIESAHSLSPSSNSIAASEVTLLPADAVVTNNKAATDSVEAMATASGATTIQSPQNRRKTIVAAVLVAAGIVSGLSSAFCYGALLYRGEQYVPPGHI